MYVSRVLDVAAYEEKKSSGRAIRPHACETAPQPTEHDLQSAFTIEDLGDEGAAQTRLDINQDAEEALQIQVLHPVTVSESCPLAQMCRELDGRHLPVMLSLIEVLWAGGVLLPKEFANPVSTCRRQHELQVTAVQPLRCGRSS